MKHLLPLLPYDVTALDPHIDTRTMILHHDMHHASYVRALNLVLESASESLREKTADWLLMNLSKVPERIRMAVRNNAGAHMNHSLLWRAMSPGEDGGGGAPSGPLAAAIEHAFDSLEKFKSCFEEAGSKLQGSGWVWLVKTRHGDDKLRVITTSGHDNPLTQGYVPLLVNDLWEHAYYLKYENRRLEYLRSFWSVVNWKEAARRLEYSRHVAKLPSAVRDTLLEIST